ncbi:reverse transcriptase [Elysia marginata]|uniref:Reverse transcriptase n=1 Tax=Elysia marginata TaxID=1093978 RepID=A0AAV4HRJ0_9GAST|nr:reverse transcriptase [Elysia marginata]
MSQNVYHEIVITNNHRSSNQNADIWTVARATQLLSSADEVVVQIARRQLRDTSKRPGPPSPTRRHRWTAKLLNAPVQGRVARGQDLDKSTKDLARLQSSRSGLSFNAWSYWAKLRTNGLAVREAPVRLPQKKLCRRCRLTTETTSHVISTCPVHLPEMTGRHDRVQTILMDLLWDLGIKAVPNTRPAKDDRAVPDVTVTREMTPVYIDVTVPFDEPANLHRAGQDKRDKYSHLGTVLPLVVGALGSWLPENDAIRTTFNIPHRRWNAARLRMRASTIEDSCGLARGFLHL